MKILVLINDFSGGGAERVVQTLSTFWTKTGYDVTIATLDKQNLDYDLDDNIKISPLPLANLSRGTLKFILLPFQAYFLNRAIGKNKPDIIISFLGRANIVNILSGNFFSTRPTLISERTRTDLLYSHFVPKDIVMKYLIKWLYPYSDMVLCLSDYVSSSIKAYGIPEANVKTIYNPQDLRRIKQLGKKLSPKITTRPYIVSCGRLVDQKDFATLIKSFKKVREVCNVDLVILGEGPLRSELESLAKSLNIAEHVHLVGWKKNPFAIMANAEIFALSSKIEGFGNVIVEAMALGLPIVCTNGAGGPSEILSNGEHGFLVPVGDEKKLSDAIIKLLQDSQLLNLYKAKSLERANDFNVEKIAPQYILTMKEAFKHVLNMEE